MGKWGWVVLVTLATSAWGHEAPTGWTYPWECCSSMDCQEVADEKIGEGSEGYTVRLTGEVIPFHGDSRVKVSPDGHFHWCAHTAGPDKNKTICLFVPPRGF
jgi:hypothetical protein